MYLFDVLLDRSLSGQQGYIDDAFDALLLLTFAKITTSSSRWGTLLRTPAANENAQFNNQ